MIFSKKKKKIWPLQLKHRKASDGSMDSSFIKLFPRVRVEPNRGFNVFIMKIQKVVENYILKYHLTRIVVA